MRTPNDGRSKRPEYSVWCGMKQRCLNENAHHFCHYGGRGITIAPEWVDSFWRFLADIGPRPGKEFTLDRIDNDGNYEPGNCRWVKRKTQNRNSRSNRLLTFNGKTQSMSAWAEEVGISYGTLKSRFRAGWTVERALTYGHYKRLSADQEKEIKQRAAKGETPKEISKDYGVSRHTVWRVITGKKSR